jgi:hypothetical protein
MKICQSLSTRAYLEFYLKGVLVSLLTMSYYKDLQVNLELDTNFYLFKKLFFNSLIFPEKKGTFPGIFVDV